LLLTAQIHSAVFFLRLFLLFRHWLRVIYAVSSFELEKIYSIKMMMAENLASSLLVGCCRIAAPGLRGRGIQGYCPIATDN
jgi:hypothetical protein